MIAAMIAANSTAPAAASFAFFASGCFSRVTRSTQASTEVLTSSRLITSANRRRQINHSVTEIRSSTPKSVTRAAARRWILIFLSVLIVLKMPAKAYPKLLYKGDLFLIAATNSSASDSTTASAPFLVVIRLAAAFANVSSSFNLSSSRSFNPNRRIKCSAQAQKVSPAPVVSIVSGFLKPGTKTLRPCQ